MLFVSGLILLVDFAPHDLLRKTREQKQAIGHLIKDHPLVSASSVSMSLGISDWPSGSNIAIDLTKGGAVDPDAVRLLTELIREHSSFALTVPWDRVIGVDYSTMRMPVGSHKTVEGLHALVAVATPVASTGRVTELENFPVGMLDDLDKWIAAGHQRSVTFWAGVLLTAGFALQLWLSCTTPERKSLRRKRRSGISSVADGATKQQQSSTPNTLNRAEG